MGCDIHGWVERKIKNKWVAISPLQGDARARNYARFAAIASVRGKGERDAIGMPEDASDTAAYDADKLGIDGHSHSHIPLKDAGLLWRDTAYEAQFEANRDQYPYKNPLSNYFNWDEECEGPIEEYRVVFWFDN